MPVPQHDLPCGQAEDGVPPQGEMTRSSLAERRGVASSIWPDPETAAAVLHGHPDYRILRRLRPRPLAPLRLPRTGERLAIIVDTETTGLDQAHDEVIEIGIVAFIHDRLGSVAEVVGLFSALREPTRPISPEITRLTGITADMVAGQAIDIEALERFIEPADLVIAHNAAFDRPFCERLARGFDVKAWACSNREIRWAELGFEGSKLGYLVGQFGWFHQGHRAVDDCHALLEVLAATAPGQDATGFQHLLRAADQTRVRLFAEQAPFDQKDRLKQRGYRWNAGDNGRPKCWWTEVAETDVQAEINVLQQEIYRRPITPRQKRITAFERFKADA